MKKTDNVKMCQSNTNLSKNQRLILFESTTTNMKSDLVSHKNLGGKYCCI